jgi:hypothetical protein
LPILRTRQRKEAAVNLDPGTYVCPVHHVDLTDIVRARLQDEQDAEFAFGGFPGSRAPSAAAPRPFQVVVSCSGGGTPHRLVFDGAYTP